MTAARIPEPRNVAERAYEIWEEEGRPHGRDRAHWDRAEQELTVAPSDGAAPAAEPPADVPVVAKPARARKAAAPAEGEQAAKPARAKKAAVAADGAAAAPKRTRAKKPAEG